MNGNYADNMSREFIWKLLMTFISVFFIISISDIVSASTGGGGATNDVIGEGFCRILNVLQGGFFKGVATFALIALILSAMFGQVRIPTVLITCAAIVLIFKAPDIVNLISGETGNPCQGVTP